ncbi:MAG TPA: DUF4333 domain-containing protein [Amycolatopsis sp.]|nr:DUF4333 domain-containing protein [Amycolatopsis sp.]
MKLRAVFFAVCAVFALAGCSADATVSKENLQNGIADALQKSVGQRPDSVECPGSVKAKAGETTRCVLTAGSTKYGLTATITSYDDGTAHYNVQVDNKPMN